MTIALELPNYQDLDDSLKQQSAVDTGDFKNIAGAIKGTVVLSGGAVSANSGLQISVAAGSGRIAGVPVTWNAATPTHDAADDTDPRVDVVVVNSSGTVSILKGGAAEVTSTGGPEWASSYDPDSYILLARIDVTAAAEAVATANIVDKRIFSIDAREIVANSPGIGLSPDASDNAAALALCTEGDYVIQQGTYEFTTQCDLVQSGSLRIRGIGDVWLKAAETNGFGDISGVGCVIEHDAGTSTSYDDVFRMTGIRFSNEHMQASTTTWPFGDEDALTAWPYPNGASETALTAEVWRTRNAKLDTWEVDDCEFWSSPPGEVMPHWTSGGGDSLIYVDADNTRHVRFTNNKCRGSNDSAFYCHQDGTRNLHYAATVTIEGNHLEGCARGIAVKGAIGGGSISHNTFANVAYPILLGDTSVGGSAHQVTVSHNHIDGYVIGVLLKGTAHVVHDNKFINAGHFYPVAGVETSTSAADDLLDDTYVIQFGADGDPADDCVAYNNYVEGVATDGERGRSTDWGGNDPVVFYFQNGDDNRCYDNWIIGSDYTALAQDNSGAGSSGNIVSWSRPEMVGDHSLAYTGKHSTSRASGPVMDAHMTADDSYTSDNNDQPISEFTAPVVAGARYRLEGMLWVTGDQDGDARFSVKLPGSSTATGDLWVDAPGSSATGTGSAGSWVTATVDNGGSPIRIGCIDSVVIPAAFYADFLVADSGNMTIEVAQWTSDATPTVFKMGSRAKLTRVA
jgi:hypothetical protein